MTENDLVQAIEDIAELKKTIRGTLKTMRPILIDPVFVPFSLAAALLFSLLFLALHLVIARWGSFDAVPLGLRVGIPAAGVGVFALSGLMKLRIINRGLHRLGVGKTLRALFRDREFRGLYVLVEAGFLGVAAVGWRLAAETGSWGLALPILALYMGFALSLFALTFGTAEYFAVGTVSAAFGLAALAFMRTAPLLWLSAYCAVLFVAYAAAITLANRKGGKAR